MVFLNIFQIRQIFNNTYFEEHLRTTASESKPLRCIAFIKMMANVSSCGKFLSNHHLFLFICSRFKVLQS